MLDIITFIPRLVWDIILFIWGIIKFIGEFIWRFISVFLPDDFSAGNEWLIFFGIVVLFLLAFLLRGQFGGMFKALIGILVGIGAGTVMFLINPWGLGVTIFASLLMGFDLLKSGRLIYMGLGLMWAVMLVMRVVG